MTHLRGERKSIELCAKCGNVNYYPVDDIDDYAELLLKRMEERKNESI
jgi:hypothetical protein